MKTQICTIVVCLTPLLVSLVSAEQISLYKLSLPDQPVGTELNKEQLHCESIKTTDKNLIVIAQDIGGLSGRCLQLIHAEASHDSPSMYLPIGRIAAGLFKIEFDASMISSTPGPEFAGAETLLSFALLNEHGQYAWGLQFVNTQKDGGSGVFGGTGLQGKTVKWRVGQPVHIRVEVDLDQHFVSLWIDHQAAYEKLPIDLGGPRHQLRLMTIRDGVTLGGRDGLFAAALQNLRMTLQTPDITELRSPNLGNLFLDKDVLGPTAKPITFQFRMKNALADKPVEAVYQAALRNDHGEVLTIPSRKIEIPANSAIVVPLTFQPPGYGFFDLQVQATMDGQTQTIDSSLCVLHQPHDGVRPESMFGLGIGESFEDRQIAQLIGVKWRRGIPFTNPTDVSPKPGEFWQQSAIDRARQAISDWKDAGVLCLGYVNYNMPWNVEPDPLGRKIYPHQNRPKDLSAQAEVVYHLIKPLSDLVRHWELWNEPWVHSWTWRTGTAQDYRDMTRLIWDRIKPEMPDIQLIGGGSTAYHRDVVFARGSKNTGYVDGLTNHPYGPPDDNVPSIAGLDSHMLGHGSKGKGQGGLWYTEVGTGELYFKELPEAERPYMVARSLTPIYVLNKIGAGTNDIKLFAFASQYNRRFSGDEFNWWKGTQPKPVVAAYSAMTHILEDAVPVGDLLADSKMGWAVLFTRSDGANIVVFWPDQGIHGHMSLPALDFQTFDYLGRAIGESQNGQLTFPIQTWETRYLISHQSPQQIRAAFSRLRMSGVAALAIHPCSFVAPLDTRPALRIAVLNLLPQTTNAELDVTVPPEIRLAQTHVALTDLKPGEQRVIELPVTAAKSNAINRYPISYKAVASGIEQSGTQTVQVACATLGSPRIDGDLTDWAKAVPVTMISRGGKDFLRIVLNPDLAAELLAQPQATDTVVYRLWMQFDQKNLYIAADVPDATLTTNSTFEDNPYSFPFNADNIQLAFNCNAEHADDLLRDSPLYEKSCDSAVDYEFCATLARFTNDGPWYAQKPAWSGDWSKAPRVPQLHRLLAPGTNYQTFYVTNAPTTPPLGAMQAAATGGPEGQVVIDYDDEHHVFRYEIAIPWSCLADLQEQVVKLAPGRSLTTRFAWAVTDAGGRGKTFWQDEAGGVEAGAYGFSPHWGGGNRNMGGRINTDWGFYRPVP